MPARTEIAAESEITFDVNLAYVRSQLAYHEGEMADLIRAIALGIGKPPEILASWRRRHSWHASFVPGLRNTIREMERAEARPMENAA